MANAKQLAKLKQGSTEWNRWIAFGPKEEIDLRELNLTSPDLLGVNLSHAHLDEANLTAANLKGLNLTGIQLTNANLTECILRDTELRGADLHGARLRGAVLINSTLTEIDLSGADLTVADLRGANLEKANLMDADLSFADLSGANLASAKLDRTKLGKTNLSNVRGLEGCVHEGPSFLDHTTITQSWPLPLAFLRGCGLPESLITYLPSLLNQPIQFYSCFISYSTKDQPFADRLHADLQNAGVRCWFAPHDMAPGKKIHEQIDEAIRLHDKLLLILSPHSIHSEWVKTEIAKARKRELKENRRMLFPLSLVRFQTLQAWECFDADTGKDSAREIREYFIPDFSTWKNHDSYQTTFIRLLRSLEAKDTTAAEA